MTMGPPAAMASITRPAASPTPDLQAIQTISISIRSPSSPLLLLRQTFKSPPAAVKLVMEAVCVMLDVKPTMVADPMLAGKKIADYWDASKKILSDSGG